MSFATWLNKVFSVVHQLKGRLFSVQHDRFNSVRKTWIQQAPHHQDDPQPVPDTKQRRSARGISHRDSV